MPGCASLLTKAAGGPLPVDRRDGACERALPARRARGEAHRVTHVLSDLVQCPAIPPRHVGLLLELGTAMLCSTPEKLKDRVPRPFGIAHVQDARPFP